MQHPCDLVALDHLNAQQGIPGVGLVPASISQITHAVAIVVGGHAAVGAEFSLPRIAQSIAIVVAGIYRRAGPKLATSAVVPIFSARMGWESA